jgi:hypothetical protein
VFPYAGCPKTHTAEFAEDLACTWLAARPSLAVQCTLFDKSPTKNWLVALHQDSSIPVSSRVNSPERSGWSEKEGHLYVQPPVSVLERLVALRVHIANFPAENGALRLVPHSHLEGRIDPSQSEALRRRHSETVVPIAQGGVLLMRPLILHASSKATSLVPRRVLHFVFGPLKLPLGLEAVGGLGSAHKSRIERAKHGKPGSACLPRSYRQDSQNCCRECGMADERVGKSSETVTQPSGVAAPVLISYASQDTDTADTICRSLESQGIPCWIAPRNVKPGAQYADAIVRAINEAKAVVLVMSTSAVDSAHVAREVERAASKRKPIIPFRVDAAALNPELEYFLSNAQWIDVPALGMPAALAKLAEAVGQGSAAPSQAVATGRKAGSKKRIGIAAAGVVALGVVVGLSFYLWKSNHGSSVQAPLVTAITDKSIAVLPFVDMSEKKDQEYFGDGMAEEIIDLLVKGAQVGQCWRVAGETRTVRDTPHRPSRRGPFAQLAFASCTRPALSPLPPETRGARAR